MVVHATVGAGTFIEFTRRLLEGADGMIFVIVDGHPSNQAKRVQKYLESVRNRFRPFFLPPHSPEFNPAERVSTDLNNTKLGRRVVSSAEELKQKQIGQPGSIQRSAERVSGYFNNALCSGLRKNNGETVNKSAGCSLLHRTPG